eukprot:COSAG05_NODE_12_length_37297_cov_117.537072_14_plen_91_part_00
MAAQQQQQQLKMKDVPEVKGEQSCAPHLYSLGREETGPSAHCLGGGIAWSCLSHCAPYTPEEYFVVALAPGDLSGGTASQALVFDQHAAA